MLPIECVVRGYLAGSGWKDYLATAARSAATGCRPACGSRSGSPARSSRRRRRRTRATTRTSTATQAAELVGVELLAEVERVSIALYEHAAAYAAERGIVIADTKFELGLDPDGVLTLGDEALTPDSSRFWPADEYEPGRGQPSFDKQYVRDYCESLGWDKTPPGPELPQEVVDGTRARYVEAFERLTGDRVRRLPRRPGRGAPMRATVLVRPKGGILDPQGEAVERSLRQLGFPVGDARVGRVIDLEVDASTTEDARAQVEQMCERLLANPLIESYEIELEARRPA